VNSSLVASPSDPELASDSIMIKWRSVRTSPLRESCSLLALSPLFAVAHLSLLSRQDSVLGRRTPSLFRVASWCRGWWLSLSRRSLGSLFTVCCPPCPPLTLLFDSSLRSQTPSSRPITSISSKRSECPLEGSLAPLSAAHSPSLTHSPFLQTKPSPPALSADMCLGCPTATSTC
jgi:hypothetical protein